METNSAPEDQRGDMAATMPLQVNCNLTPGCYHGTAEEKQRLMGVLERQRNTHSLSEALFLALILDTMFLPGCSLGNISLGAGKKKKTWRI